MILVLGAAGFIGSSFRRSPVEGEIYTTRNPIEPGLIRFDPLTDSISSIPGITLVTHVLILSAEREPDRCVADPAGTARVNVDLPKRIIRQCQDLGLTPIFASSELVFNGQSGMYREDDTPSPILEYGRQKLATERFLLETCPSGLVLRFPKTVGRVQGDRSLFTNWLEQIAQGDNELTCATDQRFSLQFVDSVPLTIRTLVNNNARGVLHLGDGVRHSRVELLQELLQVLRNAGYKTPSIRAVSIDDIDFMERRPKDVSLDASALLNITGIQSPCVPDYLSSLVKERSIIA